MNAEIPERTVMNKLRVMAPMITQVTVANSETLHPEAVKAGFAKISATMIADITAAGIKLSHSRINAGICALANKMIGSARTEIVIAAQIKTVMKNVVSMCLSFSL